jgi:hypothetical protein
MLRTISWSNESKRSPDLKKKIKAKNNPIPKNAKSEKA